MRAGDIVASKYRLIARIGQGGMGSVWKASNTFTGREFAIKFLLAQVAMHDDSRHRFAQEARASARINHPNAIDVYDVGEAEDGGLYLVMELLDGISLAEALRAQPGFNARELLIVLAEASTALNAAHNSGVIHRDLKPGNIFLHKDRASGYVTAKVLDFGVSKLLGADEGVATHTGSLLGSPRYMAPEQAISASQADARSDVWSLGVVLFEALTGRFPHDGENSNNLIIAIATTPPKSISEVAPHLPLSLRQLVDDCLKPAAQRIANIRVFLDRALAILATEDLTQIPLAKPSVARGKSIGRPDGLMFRTTAGAIPGLATSMLHQQGLDALAQHLAAPAGMPSAPSSHHSFVGPPPAAPSGVNPAYAQMPPGSGRPDLSQSQPNLSSSSGSFAALPPVVAQQSASHGAQMPHPSLANLPLTRQTVRIPVMQASPAFHAAAAASDPTIESVSSINVVRADRNTSTPPIRAQAPTRKYLIALVGVLSVGAVLSVALVIVSAGNGDKKTSAASSDSARPTPTAATQADTKPQLIEPKPTASTTAAATTSAAPSAVASSSATPAASSTSVAATNPNSKPTTGTPGTIPSVRPKPSSTKVTGLPTGLE